MSWTARITKAPDDSLRLQFSEPLRHIDMDRATARHLAALLVVAAGEKRCAPLDPAEHDLEVLRQAAKRRKQPSA
jgi:hypothetical protein